MGVMDLPLSVRVLSSSPGRRPARTILTGMGDGIARGQSWSVRSRIVAAILAVAAVGMTVAGGTAYLVERGQTLRDVDETLLHRVEAARAVALAYVPDTPPTDGSTPEDEASNPEADGTFAPADPDAQENPDPTDQVSVPPLPEKTASTAQEVLHAIFRAVIPGPGESSVGLIDGQAVIIPGVALDFELHRDPDFLATAALLGGGDAVAFGDARLDGRTLRYVAVPVAVQGDASRGTYIAAVDRGAALRVIETTFQVYTVAAIGTLIAIGLVGWFVAGRLLRPLRQLRAAALQIADTRSLERIPVDGRDDVSQLARAFNEMLDRLAESAEGQRRLLDDVRHELKTPITIVRGHLELLDSGRVDEVDATRELVLDELDRMVDLVDGLELLAEVNRELVHPEPVDIAQLIREVHTKASAIPGHRWVLESVAEGVAVLDRHRVTQALLQLADNAAKFSPVGAEIRLSSRTDAERVMLVVDDDGPGVPAGAEERIFDRFGRASTGRGVRGSGLGLPIVRTIAEAHGGQVTAEPSASGGARFTLVLPLAPHAATDPDTLDDEEETG